jgi:hypothetical protein
MCVVGKSPERTSRLRESPHSRRSVQRSIPDYRHMTSTFQPMTCHIPNTTHAFLPHEDCTGVNDPTFLLVAWPTVDQLPYATENGIHDDVRLLHGLYDQVVAGGLHDAVARNDRQQTKGGRQEARAARRQTTTQQRRTEPKPREEEVCVRRCYTPRRCERKGLQSRVLYKERTAQGAELASNQRDVVNC